VRPLRVLAWWIATIAGLAVAAVLGWAYWHASSHGTLYVYLYDVGLRSANRLSGPVVTADLVFRDSAGNVLANGKVDQRVVWMIHPEVGDCRREQHQGMTVWRNCFDAHSKWLMTWARRVHDARISLDTCTIDRVPVLFEESRDHWWLWWVPLPHIDNSVYTNFKFTAGIDSVNCRPASTIE
jgi:hypothetical protein